jgi:hypothetical protein
MGLFSYGTLWPRYRGLNLALQLFKPAGPRFVTCALRGYNCTAGIPRYLGSSVAVVREHGLAFLAPKVHFRAIMPSRNIPHPLVITRL